MYRLFQSQSIFNIARVALRGEAANGIYERQKPGLW